MYTQAVLWETLFPGEAKKSGPQTAQSRHRAVSVNNVSILTVSGFPAPSASNRIQCAANKQHTLPSNIQLSTLLNTTRRAKFNGSNTKYNLFELTRAFFFYEIRPN